jgi:hypothetical protein
MDPIFSKYVFTCTHLKRIIVNVMLRTRESTHPRNATENISLHLHYAKSRTSKGKERIRKKNFWQR